MTGQEASLSNELYVLQKQLQVCFLGITHAITSTLHSTSLPQVTTEKTDPGEHRRSPESQSENAFTSVFKAARRII